MKTYTLLAACFLLLGTAWAQEYTTPVPILKQINRHNEDGSYSYGYEAADGSFKIETKYQTGEVYGKYGYVDDTGKVREVEYGASRRGFEPAGNDINVPPPTLTQSNAAPLPEGQEDDGQYREDPSVYYKDDKYNAKNTKQTYKQPAPAQPLPQRSYYQAQPQPQPQSQPQTYYQPQPQPQPQPQTYYQPQPQPQPQTYYQPQPQPQPQTYYNQPQPQPYYQPQQNYYQPDHRFNPQPYQLNPAQYVTHPAVKNIDYFSGSYSIDYSGKRRK